MSWTEVDEIGKIDNLLASLEWGILILDRDLSVRRFSPAIREVLPYEGLAQDCSLEELAQAFPEMHLAEDARSVLEDAIPVAREVKISNDRWCMQRILPYRSVENHFLGLMVTYSDVTRIKNIETAYRHRVGFLQLLTDALPVRMAYVDNEERYRYANEMYFSWLDKSKEKVIGFTLLEVLGPEVYEKIGPYIRQALEGKRTRFEACLHYKGVGFREVLVDCAPHLGDDGLVTGVFGVILDITERKETERNNARLAAIVEHSGDAIISGDFDGTVRSWNRAAEKIYGYSAEEMIGNNVSRLFPGEKDENLQETLAVLQLGKVVQPFEAQRQRKDGSLVDVLVTLSPILDSSGIPVAVSVISHDISGRKAMENALRQQEKLHRTIGETVPFGTWMTDAEGRCTHVTESFLRMSGMSMAEVAEFGWLERVPPEERQRLRQAWLHCVNTGEDWEYEYRFLGADGLLYDIYTIGRPVRDDNGKILYWAGFHLDNTERKRVEKELHELNRTLEVKVAERTNALEQHMSQLRRLALELTQTEQRERERLGKVLHDDLQQLLVAVALRIERLGAKVGDEKVLEILRETEDLLGRASSTARNLAADLRPPMLSNASLIEGLRLLVVWIWQRFDLAVHLEILDNFNPRLIPAELAAYLFAAVRELLFNVVKHAQVKNARLCLGLDEKKCLFLSVIDGVVGSEQAAVGEWQSFGGSSGLRNIKERLQLLGGTLEIQTGQGKGFKVDVHLPYSGDSGLAIQIGTEPEKERINDLGTAKAEGEGAKKKIRIMLVDDHRIVRDGLRMILQEEDDFEVVAEAPNGRQALSIAKEVMPDVIIMDINMPGMNGIDATRQIKLEMSDICVVSLSVNDDSGSINAMQEAGACGYYLKSGPPEELCRIIRSCGEKSQEIKRGPLKG